MVEYLQVGVITSAHGVHGEVNVYPTTDDPARFTKLKTVLLDTGKQNLTLHIRSVKFFKDTVILGFTEFHDRNEAERYPKCPLLVLREQAVPLAENENYIADLYDMDVFTDEGWRLGTLTEVLFTGANDVYIVTTEEGREILLPAIAECILRVDVEENRMIVHLLPGLLDL